MGWLLASTIGYFFNAVSVVVDKSLLNKNIPHPVVYAFYISLLGMLAFVLAPFGLTWIGSELFLYSLIAGAFFTLALLAMFHALAKDEATRVTPVIGGFSPIFVLILSYFIIGERLSAQQMIAFSLIFIGSIFISIHWRKIKQQSLKVLGITILAAFLFAAHYVMVKYVYDNSDFISGFLWTRVGSLIVAFFLFAKRDNRKVILANMKGSSNKMAALLIVGQAAGALSGIMVNYAVSLGSVTLVNALQGIQYVFLFIIVLVLAKKYPHWLQEETRGNVLIQKIIAISLIVSGIYLLG